MGIPEKASCTRIMQSWDPDSPCQKRAFCLRSLNIAPTLLWFSNKVFPLLQYCHGSSWIWSNISCTYSSCSLPEVSYVYMTTMRNVDENVEKWKTFFLCFFEKFHVQTSTLSNHPRYVKITKNDVLSCQASRWRCHFVQKTIKTACAQNYILNIYYTCAWLAKVCMFRPPKCWKEWPKRIKKLLFLL